MDRQSKGNMRRVKQTNQTNKGSDTRTRVSFTCASTKFEPDDQIRTATRTRRLDNAEPEKVVRTSVSFTCKNTEHETTYHLRTTPRSTPPRAATTQLKVRGNKQTKSREQDPTTGSMTFPETVDSTAESSIPRIVNAVATNVETASTQLRAGDRESLLELMKESHKNSKNTHWNPRATTHRTTHTPAHPKQHVQGPIHTNATRHSGSDNQKAEDKGNGDERADTKTEGVAVDKAGISAAAKEAVKAATKATSAANAAAASAHNATKSASAAVTAAAYASTAAEAAVAIAVATEMAEATALGIMEKVINTIIPTTHTPKNTTEGYANKTPRNRPYKDRGENTDTNTKEQNAETRIAREEARNIVKKAISATLTQRVNTGQKDDTNTGNNNQTIRNEVATTEACISVGKAINNILTGAGYVAIGHANTTDNTTNTNYTDKTVRVPVVPTSYVKDAMDQILTKQQTGMTDYDTNTDKPAGGNTRIFPKDTGTTRTADHRKKGPREHRTAEPRNNETTVKNNDSTNTNKGA